MVVLPVPLTPQTISTVGRSRIAMRSSPSPAAVSASSSIRRSRIGSPASTSPASTSISSLPTTSAVVGAPTSAMISASSRRSQVSASSVSKRLAESSAWRALRDLPRLSRRLLKKPRRSAGCSAGARGGDLAVAEIEDFCPLARHRARSLGGFRLVPFGGRGLGERGLLSSCGRRREITLVDAALPIETP